MTTRERFLELLGRLVAIDSVNPEIGGGPGEAEIARFCHDWFRDRDIEAELVEVAPSRCPEPSSPNRSSPEPSSIEPPPPGSSSPEAPSPERFNVYARVRGRGSGVAGAGEASGTQSGSGEADGEGDDVQRFRPAPSILLNAHLDTVGVEGMEAPFELRVEGDRARGRGAYDMKAGVAIAMLVAERFAGASESPPGDLLITLVADEEERSRGTEALVRDWLPSLERRPGGAVVLEPTEEEVAVAHKGFAWLEVETAGRAAHGSRPWLGIDAIARLGPLIEALGRLDEEFREADPHELLGYPSLHFGTVEGGTGWSLYPDRAVLRYERRTLPGEGDFLGELEGVLRQIGYRVERVAKASEGRPAAAGEGEDRAGEDRADRDADGDDRNGGDAAGRYEVRRRELVFERPPHTVAADAAVVRGLQEAVGTGDVAGLSFWTDAALLGEAGVPTVVYGPGGTGAHAVEEWVDVSSSLRVLDAVTRLVAAGLPGD